MNTTYRNIAVILEAEYSIKYLRKGLAELQSISGANDFYEPTFIYLSGGLERLFKTMLCMNFRESHDRLPSKGEIWSYKQGHDLVFLKGLIEKICIPTTSHDILVDYEIITQNNLINVICQTLSEYGKKARYFNLDAILGIEQEFDAKSSWEKIENKVLIEHYGEESFYSMVSVPAKLEELYMRSCHLLVSQIELFLRALTRQFLFGDFSKEARTLVSIVEPFSQLGNNDIGTTDYRKFPSPKSLVRNSWNLESVS